MALSGQIFPDQPATSVGGDEADSKRGALGACPIRANQKRSGDKLFVEISEVFGKSREFDPSRKHYPQTREDPET